jgi:hypothetical protein
MSPAAVRDAAQAPKAASILRHDYYGWFERVERGIYALTPAGKRSLAAYVVASPPAAAQPLSD